MVSLWDVMQTIKRVCVCVLNSSHYPGARLSGTILSKQLKVEGFIVHRWLARWPDAFKEMNEWIDKVRFVS